jgi:L-asparaginase type I
MRHKVHLLTTGGTIAHLSNQDGIAVMSFDPARLLASVNLPDIDLECTEVLRKGSMDIVPNDWRAIASATAAALYKDASGIVILHGTDTMHYTAAALSFMLQELSVPVVLTGSMVPGGDSGSDALPNLRDAILIAAYADIAEICVVFSADAERSKGMVIRGSRARKVRSHSIDAFASINEPPIAYVAGDKLIFSEVKRRLRRARTLRTAFDIEEDVALIKPTPGLTPRRLKQQLEGTAAAVLEGTGVGHIRSDLGAVVADFRKPVVISTQAVYGGERLGAYTVDKQILNIPNIIPAGDMSSETSLVKLMWALKQKEDIRALMQRSVAGEITSRGSTSALHPTS